MEVEILVHLADKSYVDRYVISFMFSILIVCNIYVYNVYKIDTL